MFSSETVSNREQNKIIYTFNEVVYDSTIDHRTESFHLKVMPKEEGQSLHIESYTSNPKEGFCRAGCFIQKLDPFDFDVLSYSKPAQPVISCIILLTFNSHFVQNFLIPSIIAYTTIPYEIIIVYNGSATNLIPFKNFNLIYSQTGCVSKAYNKGVAAANGRYISIFHDDCLVTSSDWHQPMIEAINRGAFATSTESVYNPHIDLEFLKGTPLLMTKSNYELIGGHDEFFFAGIEDLDFSYRIQLRGYLLKKIKTPYRHFCGMSTVILFSDNTEGMRTLFGYCLVPKDTIEKWKTTLMGTPETQRRIQAVYRENLKYFTDKISMSGYSCKLTNVQSLSIDKYPALSNIRNTYQEWLVKKFHHMNVMP